LIQILQDALTIAEAEDANLTAHMTQVKVQHPSTCSFSPLHSILFLSWLYDYPSHRFACLNLSRVLNN
jgi:hypothetical protein